MRKSDIPGLDTKALLEHILTSQGLLLARQLRSDDSAREKTAKVDYERKAVQLIRNAREAIIFRWNYELPGQDQV